MYPNPTPPQRVSNRTILIINLVPLLGVLFLGWSGGMIASLYAIETVFIGLLNVVKMIMTKENAVQKFFLIPFFMIHYGIFVSAQGLVIIGLSIATDKEMLAKPYFLYFFGIALLSVFIGQLIVFWRDFLQPKAYLNASVGELMFQPYTRVFIQQFVVIFGMFMTLVLKWHMAFAFLLIFLKTTQELSLNKIKVEKSAY